MAGSASAAPGGKNSGTKLFFSAGLKAGYGTMASEDGASIASRGFGVYGLDSDLGLSFGGLKAGVGIDYSLWRQIKDPKELSNSNTQGKAFSWGPMLGYDFGSFEVLARYLLGSSYSLDKSNSAGQEISYTSPASALAFQLRFPFGSGVPYFGLEYKMTTYEKAEVGTQEITFSSSAKVKTSAFGLMFGLSY